MPLAEIPLEPGASARDIRLSRPAIRYWTAGQGEPLLLIHGFPTASWDWHYLWQPLAQRYRVIACDMLGFGDSAKPLDHAYSLLEQADLQQALLAHLRVEQPVHVWLTTTVTAWPRNCWRGITKAGSRWPVACSSTAGCSRNPSHGAGAKTAAQPLGWMIGRAFSRDALADNFSQIFGPDTRPSERLDDFWSLIELQ
jgi:hypothetical protein